eukprot:TRINITY_DN12449_c0_g1_i1.p1 TRINITY_DN12449_c0_g1~~TRINITY_DN12449_c0_g1_i1.p1  ORF type:complete len:182 (+),score=8.65 TRINITY_DN12449_c0_g1_i1:333-878(+)
MTGNFGSDITAINATSGKFMWQVPLGSCGYVATKPAFDEAGNSFFSCGNYSISFDPHGHQRWSSKNVGPGQSNFATNLALPLNSAEDSRSLFFMASNNAPDNPPPLLKVCSIHMRSGAFATTPCFSVPLAGKGTLWYASEMILLQKPGTESAILYVVQRIPFIGTVVTGSLRVSLFPVTLL